MYYTIIIMIHWHYNHNRLGQGDDQVQIQMVIIIITRSTCEGHLTSRHHAHTLVTMMMNMLMTISDDFNDDFYV